MIARLLATADEVRRHGLNFIDDDARASSTFGSKEHRAARGDVEQQWNREHARFSAMSDEELRGLVEIAT